MSMTDSAPLATEAPVDSISVPEGTPQAISPSDAARILSNHRQTKRQAAASAEQPAAEPPQESAPEADAAPAEEPPSGALEGADPEVEELPPVEPPKRWKSEKQEHFKTLPRDLQEYIVESARAEELEVRRVQNEAAEQRKAVEVETQAAKQVRQQLEQALEWQLASALNGQEAQEFADIRTPEDALRLSREDPIRSGQYQAWMNVVRGRAEQYQQLQTQKQQEQTQEWHSFAASEDARFAEEFPDAQKLREPAIDYFRKVGFSDKEITENYNSKFWRDHRVQRVFRDAILYQTAQKAKVDVAKKAPVPPVSQRPGVASGKQATKAAHRDALEQQLTKTGSWKDAAKLYMERRGKP